jgi:hypothetical protein
MRCRHPQAALRYRRQVNRKTKEGSRHPNRGAQFEQINQQVVTLQAAGQPVISVNTVTTSADADSPVGIAEVGVG